jgi:excisionase family DNA binding protein
MSTTRQPANNRHPSSNNATSEVAGRRPYATPQDLAAYVNVALQTVYGWRKQGKGPKATKIGGQLRFTWTDIDDWIERQQRVA